MGWYGDKIEKLKSLPNPYAVLYVTAKVLGGVGIGVLITTWLPIWTWWIFIIIACVIAIPVARLLFNK